MSCNSSVGNMDKVINYSYGNTHLNVPEEYVHRPIAISTKKKNNTGFLEIPLVDLVDKNIGNTTSKKPVLFSFLIIPDHSINKEDEMLDMYVNRINGSVEKAIVKPSEDTGWYKVFMSNITFTWYVTKNKVPINRSDYVATCTENSFADANCELPGFYATDDVFIDTVFITESQLIFYEDIKRRIKEFIIKWSRIS